MSSTMLAKNLDIFTSSRRRPTLRVGLADGEMRQNDPNEMTGVLSGGSAAIELIGTPRPPELL
jgi:hypothetical protein